MEPLTVRFEQTADDISEATRSLILRATYDPGLRKRAWPLGRDAVWIASVVYFAALGLLRLPDAIERSSWMTFWSFGPALLVFAWVRDSVRRIPELRHEAARRAHRDRHCPAWLAESGPTTVSIGESGFTIAGPFASRSFRWEAVTWVAATDHAVVVCVIFGDILTIPLRAFGDTDEAARFMREAERLCGEARGQETILARFLHSHELACPECGYSLLGVPEPKCPECGRAVRIADLAMACAVSDRPGEPDPESHSGQSEAAASPPTS